jgi:hypothetical protein
MNQRRADLTPILTASSHKQTHGFGRKSLNHPTPAQHYHQMHIENYVFFWKTTDTEKFVEIFAGH